MEELKELNLLYIEDEIRTRDNYTKTFRLLFNEVFTSDSYDEAVNIFTNELIDFILLDIELQSERNGFDISKKIREFDSNIPIVFLTGHNEKEIILEAINSNINGYIIKPLSIEKFLEVTKTLFKKIDSQKIIKFKDFIFNSDTLELFDKENRLIKLGKKETKLLQTLLFNTDKLLSREFLEYEIWSEPLLSDTTLKNLIASLRKKIGKETITNISKLGWKIELI